MDEAEFLKIYSPSIILPPLRPHTPKSKAMDDQTPGDSGIN